MSEMTIIRSPGDIDLSRHGVIEAHAGTGKTYTIVQMVLRVVEQEVNERGRDGGWTVRFVNLREILLVTYTEKAAGELRKRIREGLEKRIAGMAAGAKRDHLEACLNNLHEAFIGTIHGVCLRLLQTWPFETGVPFTTEMVDDAEGLTFALRESMRTDWQVQETHIPWALRRLRETGVYLDEEHFKLVRETALKLLDKDNTVLDRRSFGGHSLADLRSAAESGGDDREAESRFRGEVEILIGLLRQAGASGKMEPDRLLKLTARVALLESMYRSGRFDPAVLKAPCSVGRGKLFTQADYGKIPGVERIVEQSAAIAAHSFLGQLCEQEKDGRRCLLALICDAAELLRDRWLRTKREKGLISFQDMPGLMNRAVSDNPLFRTALCARLRFAIIDEFQDTSNLQWNIFSALFLGSSPDTGPRLFVVGDPKQSIYAFQGAEVESYLRAKRAIINAGGQVYGLIENFRSHPATIDGCNTVFAKDPDGPDWFAPDVSTGMENGISYPAAGAGGEVARPPSGRAGSAANELPGAAIQVMALEGNASVRRRTMAVWAGRVIGALKGKTITIPDGLHWKDITLDYRDFAVIVETNSLARPFLEQFQSEGIPAVKYKMEGVFQSPMARDLHALLRAVMYPSGDPAPRLAALLTRFFNRHPVEIDPDTALGPCHEGRRACTCIFHALEEWTALASYLRWSQLFAAILSRSKVRERLAGFADGNRHLADLRQVTDYCIEKLYRGNYTLKQLVEHLGLLLAGTERVGQDENLYTLATDRSSVKVLTMHAAKGLEFPVVFVATGGSGRKGKGMGSLSWAAPDGRRHVMPMESVARSGDEFARLFENEQVATSSWSVVKQKKGPSRLEIRREKEPLPDAQRIQERRRLLYVALTRAQAMVFVPAHLKRRDSSEDVSSWSSRALPASPDTDLTPRLLHLLDQGRIDCFDERLALWNTGPVAAAASESAGAPQVSGQVSPESLDEQVVAMDLPSLVCRQTSYTELSRAVTTDRIADRSEEPDDAGAQAREREQRAVLPGGKDTGDALHVTLEEALRREDVGTFIAGELREYAFTCLERNGVLKKIPGESGRRAAVDFAAGLIRSALSSPLPLPEGGQVTIADIDRCDRVPEMEFRLSAVPHWVHGYMDLVFRVKNDAARHPYRYFVLDWKSDTLDGYTEKDLDACMEERHYMLQARVYNHALDRYLNGLLGAAYEPEQNLGGAVYVFLRGFDSTEGGIQPVRTIAANPAADAEFTIEQISTLIGSKSRLEGVSGLQLWK